MNQENRGSLDSQTEKSDNQTKKIPPTLHPLPSEVIEMTIRVRFSETDKMGITWHGNYFSWFEMGRTEHLRATGISYRDLENAGVMFAVVSAECCYKHPALYDDLLTLKTRILKITPVRIQHEYRLFRGEELLAIGKTVLATMDPAGNVIAVPLWLKEAFQIENKQVGA